MAVKFCLLILAGEMGLHEVGIGAACMLVSLAKIPTCSDANPGKHITYSFPNKLGLFPDLI